MDYTENRGIRPAAVDGARTLEFVEADSLHLEGKIIPA